MTLGIMEIELVSARGLHNSEFFGGGIDPYVLIQYKGQEHKSTTAAGEGGAPVWNQKFKFRAEYPGRDDDYKLVVKLMDHDTFSTDDYLGQSTIYLKEILALGVEEGIAKIHPQKYIVVDHNQAYCGEIKLGVTYTPKQVQVGSIGEDVGGWKQSNCY